MKKIILALASLILASQVHAASFESIFRDNAVEIIYTSPAVTASTAAIVVDLSNTTNWPHRNSGSIDIAGIWVDFDRTGASTSTVKVGVVTSVDASSGNVTYFWVSNNTTNHVSTPGPTSPTLGGSLIRALVSSTGTTPYLLSNNKHTASTLYQTDVLLPTANGTFVAPAAGDIVVFIDGNASAAITATVHLLYSSER